MSQPNFDELMRGNRTQKESSNPSGYNPSSVPSGGTVPPAEPRGPSADDVSKTCKPFKLGGG